MADNALTRSQATKHAFVERPMFLESVCMKPLPGIQIEIDETAVILTARYAVPQPVIVTPFTKAEQHLSES